MSDLNSVQKPVRIGLIGGGSIADQRLIPALNKIPGAVFWSVLSRDQKRAQAFATKHGAQAAVPAVTELAALLSDPLLDAVIIATPDAMHAEQAIACARAGKHIFVEKPLATNSADAKSLAAAVLEAKVHLAVGYHLRYHAGHQAVLKLIEQNALGRLQHMHINWSFKSSPDDWRNARETGRWWSLAAVGTHCLDLVQWMMSPTCGAVTDVQATLNTDLHGGPHDESAVVMLRFASGASATIVTSMNFSSARTVEIVGSKGAVFCLDTLGPRGSGTIGFNRQDVPFTVVDPYLAELTDFVATISSGTPSTLSAGLTAGLSNIDLLELASAGKQ